MKIQKIKTEGFKAYDREIEVGKMAILVGPTGAGKTTILDAIQIGLYGEHASGEKKLVRPLDMLAEFSRGGELFGLEILFDSFNIQRSVAMTGKEGKEKATQKLWTSLGPGAVKKQQERIADKIGAGGLHYSVRQFVRANERERRDMLLSLLASACPLELDAVKTKIGSLPDRVNSEASHPLVWLDEIRECVADLLREKNGRKKEVDAGIRDAASSTEVGSPEEVKRRNEELQSLQSEAETISKQIGAAEQAERSRKDLVADIAQQQTRIADAEKQESDESPGIRLALAKKELKIATGAKQNREDEFHVASQCVDVAKAHREDAVLEWSLAASALTDATNAMEFGEDGNCPTCGQEWPGDVSALTDAATRAGEERESAQDKLSAARVAEDNARKESKTAEDAWRSAVNALDAAEKSVKSARDVVTAQEDLLLEKIPAMRKRLEELNSRLAAMAQEVDRETLTAQMEAVKDNQETARTALNEAQAALEKEKTKARAVLEAKRLEVELESLTAIKGGVDEIRISAVKKMIDPLTLSMDRLLGPLGSFHVLQEDGRGRACFRPGIMRDDVFRDLARLSGGESIAALFAFVVGVSALNESHGFNCPLVDDLQLLDGTMREQFLRMVLTMIEDGEIDQVFITWNAREVPDFLTESEHVSVIDLWGPSGVVSVEDAV